MKIIRKQVDDLNFYYYKHPFSAYYVGVKVGLGGEDAYPGISHFLEHVMFHNDKLGYSSEFKKLGTYVNAFTTDDFMYFYIKGTENFSKSLKLLVKMLGSIYLDEEVIQNEKNIILEERRENINDPSYQMNLKVEDMIYHNKINKREILGTYEDIKAIDKDKLLETYNKYFVKNNISIIGITKEPLNKIIKEFKNSFKEGTVLKEDIKENSDVKETFKEIEMDKITIPRTFITYKYKVEDPSREMALMMFILNSYFSYTFGFGKKLEELNLSYGFNTNNTYKKDYFSLSFSFFGDDYKTYTKLIEEAMNKKMNSKEFNYFNNIYNNQLTLYREDTESIAYIIQYLFLRFSNDINLSKLKLDLKSVEKTINKLKNSPRSCLVIKPKK